MPDEKFLLPPLNTLHRSPTLHRLDSVIKKTGTSRSFIYAGVKDGSFPKPVKIGKRAVAWTDQSVDAWIDTKIKGDNHEV